MKHVKCYIKDYPRPQFVRKNWVNLNGAWDFVFDYENKGEKLKYYKKLPFQQAINVPFSYRAPLSGVKEQKRCDNVWYSRKVNIDKLQNKRYLLNFEGSDYITKVWVNAQFAGEHKGGYARFTFDITNLIKSGENLITVKAEDGYSISQPRGKQRWQDENFSCFYEDTNGIWKTVWLEAVPDTYLKSVTITPDVPESKVDFCFSVNKLTENLSVQTVITYDSILISDCETSLLRNNRQLSVDISGEAAPFKIRYWYAHSPDLYDIKFILKINGKAVDEVGSYFAVRGITVTGNSVLINNEKLYLKMLLDQGYWKDGHLTPPDEDAIALDVKLTKEMGFNGIRKHQKIEDERFYYYCDLLGVYVWLEMPAAYEFNDEMAESFIKEWTDAVNQNKNHPCVTAWVPFNEGWGIPNVKNNAAQQKFTEAVYYLTKTLDKERRPVISNDGWEHTKSDIITIHNYAECGEWITECYRDKDKTLCNGYVYADFIRYVFADGYKYEGQPVIISEYGGIAFDSGKGWGYGRQVKDASEFLARLKSLTAAIKKLDYVCGYCLTQTTDVMQEVNGLLTMERKPKAPVKEIEEINKG